MIENNIEALLFLKGEPMTIKQLSKILKESESNVESAINSLQNNLSDRGIKLIKKEDSVMLTTSPKSSEFTKELVKEEFNSELTKASLETLSIIVYKGPINRSKIDYIRGVNSAFTVRNLLIRGLVEKVVNPKDSRSYLYKPSFQFLQYLGIQNIKDLPEYEEFNKKSEEFIENVKSDEENINSSDSA